MQNKIATVIAFIILLIALVVGLFIGISKKWEAEDKAAEERLRGLAARFCVDKPSAGFIAEARKLGCIDFWVTPDAKPGAKPADKPVESWSASTLARVTPEEFETNLKSLEEKFDKLEDGTATATLKLHFPRQTMGCTILFKQAKVTHALVSE